MDKSDDLRRKSLGDLAALHDHLISYVTFLLDLEDVIRLSCCSRLLRVFACEEPLWLGLCLKLQNGLVEFKANWRQTALAGYTARPVPPEAAEAAARPLPPLAWLSSAFLYRRWYRCHVDLQCFLPPPDAASVPRVPATAMTPGQFMEEYDMPNMPVLLQGLQDKWPAASWSLPALCAAFPSARFKVAKPHGGRAVMTLPAYVDYMARQADEEPLYVFDASFAEAAPGMRQMYEVPHVFAQDYFSQLGGGRPQYRWLVLGPARAGASWHVDPSLTSAWNALLSGRKRWALYPPHVRPPGVALDDDGEECHPDDDNLTSLQWFLEVYPGLPPARRPIEFVQNPGEVVFVPGGWWHCVLNLETAVAVTQNFVSDANLRRVVRYMAHGSSCYMARPLDFYHRDREVSRWEAAYPALMAAAAAAEADEGEEDDAEELVQEGGVQVDGRQADGDGGGAAGGVRALRLVRLGGLGVVDPVCAAEAGNSDPVGRHVKAEDTAPQGGTAVTHANGAVPIGDVASGAAVGNGGSAGGVKGAECGGRSCPAGGSGGLVWSSELEHLEVAVWRRHRPLGRWLRRMWEREPHTRPAIQECLDKYLQAAFWGAALRVIGTQLLRLPPRAGEPPASEQPAAGAVAPPQPRRWPDDPTPLELIPLVGSDAMVFLYGDLAVKIFSHEVPAMRDLMAALEGCVPWLLQPAAAAAASPTQAAAVATARSHPAQNANGAARQPPPQLPRPLACGAVAVVLTKQQRPGKREMEAAERAQEPGATGGAGAAAAWDGREQGGLHRGGQAAKAKAGTRPADPAKDEAGEEQEQELLYIVQEKRRALHELQDLLDAGLAPDHLAAVAAALGHLVGAMHATAAATAAQPASLAAEAHLPLSKPAGGEAAEQESAAGAAALAVPRVPSDVAEWERLVRTAAVWHDRPGHIWVSGLGRVSAPLEGPADDDEEEEKEDGDDRRGDASDQGVVGRKDRGPSAVMQLGAPSAAAPPTADAAGSSPLWACDVPVHSPWWPFVQHLRLRQRMLLRAMQGGGPHAAEWPAWVQQQLPTYLPADPAQLLGFEPPGASAADATAASASSCGMSHAGGLGSGSGVPPVLLHGDLTAHNIGLMELPSVDNGLSTRSGDEKSGFAAGSDRRGEAATVATAALGSSGGQQPWAPQLCLVDFADAGHGDPLYELLPVRGSCTSGDGAAMRRFWAAYRSHVDTARLWPRRGWSRGQGQAEPQPARLSYCAMCYSLLHEEAEVMLQRVWGSDLGPPGCGGAAPASGAAAALETGCGGGVADGGIAGGAASHRTLEELAESLWGFLDAE